MEQEKLLESFNFDFINGFMYNKKDEMVNISILENGTYCVVYRLPNNKRSAKRFKDLNEAKSFRDLNTVDIYSEPIGRPDDETGYLRFTFEYKMLLVHRAIFLAYHGYLPEKIDHINRNRTDNRIENLRDGTNGINQRNKSKYKNNNDTPNIMKIGKKFYFRIHNLNNKRETHICNSLLEAEQLRTIKFEEYGYTKNHNLI